jgi:hypothetical protein
LPEYCQMGYDDIPRLGRIALELFDLECTWQHEIYSNSRIGVP